MKVFALIAFFAVAVGAQKYCPPLRCQLPMKEGNCTQSIASYYYDNTANQCKPFIYTGCNGNVNRFRTKLRCTTICYSGCPTGPTTIRTPPPTGTRRPSTTTRRTTTSGTTAKPLPRRCTLKLDVGTCQQSIPRFYYDAATKSCKSFNYSGCGGNGNHFRTQQLCEETCRVA